MVLGHHGVGVTQLLAITPIGAPAIPRAELCVWRTWKVAGRRDFGLLRRLRDWPRLLGAIGTQRFPECWKLEGKNFDFTSLYSDFCAPGWRR